MGVCIGDPIPSGYALGPADCDDADPSRWWLGCLDQDEDGRPGTERVCGGEEPDLAVLPCAEDIISETPDGFLDCDDQHPDLTAYVFQDDDQDAYGDGTKVCFRVEPGWSTLSGDCANDDPMRHPGAFEVLDDAVDADCDGQDSPSCVPAVDDFRFADSPDSACSGTNLALGYAICQPTGATFAVENRAATPFAGEVSLASTSETPQTYVSLSIELSSGERRILGAGITASFVKLVADTDDCDADDNHAQIEWPLVP